MCRFHFTLKGKCIYLLFIIKYSVASTAISLFSLLSSLDSRLLLLPQSLFWLQLSDTNHHNRSNSVIDGAVPRLGRVVPCHSHDRLPWNLLAHNITIDPEFGVEI